MILSVAWAGEAPRAGDWVRSHEPGWAYEIVSVERFAPNSLESKAGRRLRLELHRHRARDRPSSAKLHAYERLHETEPNGPPAVRQDARSGANAVMRQTWDDPTDMRTNVRSARQVSGFRSMCCPLERYRRQRNTFEISDQHVVAAERLRRDADHARLGFSAGLDLSEAVSHAVGPRSGFSALAVGQSTALRDYQRAMSIFRSDSNQALIVFVVLECHSVAEWTRKQSEHGGRRYDEKVQLGRLVTLLDLLVDHYGQELQDDMRTGEVLLPMAVTA